MRPPVKVIVPEELHRRLLEHLFPGDGDEHGAVLSFGVARSDRGVRLLVRSMVLARDGVDYVPGTRGYRALTGEFVTARIRECRDGELGYLAVHNHGGRDNVAFSGDDLASHERGYPSLRQISRQPVGALVFAQGAIAGDIWWPDGERCAVDEVVVVGRKVERYRPNPPPRPPGTSELYDRQARLFGDRGQEVLRGLKVGVIGAGGAGSLVIEYLARLGVGRLLVADPDRMELSNVPRIAGSTRWDARYPFTAPGTPAWLQRVARRLAAKKVHVAHRNARRANPALHFEGVFDTITKETVARRFRDCDYIILAADSFQARLVFNALVHQYLVPGIQVGVKVPVNKSTGAVGQVFAVVRPVVPESGCLWCNGLIPPARLQDEAATPEDRAAGRYVDEDEVVAPSVISLNALTASHAVNQLLFAMTGLVEGESALLDYLRFLPCEGRFLLEEPRRGSGCLECGVIENSRLAQGDAADLPTHA